MKCWPSLFAIVAFGTSGNVLAQSELCEMSASWADIEDRNSTIMIVRQDQESFDDGDTVIVAFFNEDWSIAKGEEIGRIKVENEKGGWFENEAVSMDNGFVIWAEFDYIEKVFGGVPNSMVLSRAGKTLDRINQSELLLDWMKFRGCREKKVSQKEERERKERLAREIPKDPFAD